MIPKSAIEKAIEGGAKISPNWKYNKDGIYWSKNQYITWEEIALDPTFWQALGKALGWDFEELICKACGKDECGRGWHCGTTQAKQTWINEARRFYDLILTGQPTDKFWEEILK